jgi:hypothetical protein
LSQTSWPNRGILISMVSHFLWDCGVIVLVPGPLVLLISLLLQVFWVALQL